MVDLLDKNKALQERLQRIAEAGSRVGPVNDKFAVTDTRDDRRARHRSCRHQQLYGRNI